MEPIVRYDCTHGFFHRDIIDPKGNKRKEAIPIVDLEVALSYGEQDLKDHWELYKEKYIKRVRK